jgi:hypothetical protein
MQVIYSRSGFGARSKKSKVGSTAGMTARGKTVGKGLKEFNLIS